MLSVLRENNCREGVKYNCRENVWVGGCSLLGIVTGHSGKKRNRQMASKPDKDKCHFILTYSS